MTDREHLIICLTAFVGSRETDFPYEDADPILAHQEQDTNEADAMGREEAELAAATKLLTFLMT